MNYAPHELGALTTTELENLLADVKIWAEGKSETDKWALFHEVSPVWEELQKRRMESLRSVQRCAIP